MTSGEEQHVLEQHPEQEQKQEQEETGGEPQLETDELTEEQRAAAEAAEAHEQMRQVEAFWDSWDQYESLNAFAVDGHPAEGYNGIYLPAGECDHWPQYVFSLYASLRLSQSHPTLTSCCLALLRQLPQAVPGCARWVRLSVASHRH